MFDTKLPKDLEWIDTSDANFNHALDVLCNTNRHMLILGSGGTGKSLMLRIFYNLRKKKDNTVIVTPTGISSASLVEVGLPATTIHSFFRLSVADLFERDISDLCSDPNQVRRIRNVDTLVIDEISMVTPALFDQVFYVLSKVRGKKGCPRIVMFGDVLQLPPVVKLDNPMVKSYYDDRYNGRTGFYQSALFNYILSTNKFEYISLNQVYRQNDKDFKSALNRIRVGRPTNEDLDLINSRVIKAEDYIEKHPLMLYLASTNSKVEQLNKDYTSKFKGKPHMTYKSKSEGSLKKTPEDEITIYEGQQVMCTSNNKENGYQNGTLGEVIDLERKKVYIRKSDGEIAEVVESQSEDMVVNYDKDTKKVTVDAKGKYTMMSCKPSFACTIHKSQGLTLDNVYIDLGGWVPMCGVYLALSRCRTLEGIGLSRPITRRDVVTNPDALVFMNNMKEKMNG